MRHAFAFEALLAVAVLATGCAAGATPSSSVEDSSGVRIVASSAPVWGAEPAWRVDPEAVLDIGSADGEEPYLFDYVETALRLGDGTIVVANAGSGELRFFDSTGRHVRSVGRKGGGPGEFGQSTVHIWRSPAGDIVAEDADNRRVNVFDSTGRFRETVLLATPPKGQRPALQDVLADGAWLVVTWGDDGPPASGEARIRYIYHRYGSDGHHAATLAEVPGAVQIVVGDGGAMSWHTVPFSPMPFAIGQGAGVLVNQDGATELAQLGADGALRAIYRWGAPRRKSADLIDTYRAAALAGVTDSAWRNRTRAFLSRSLPIPEYVRAYVRAIADHAGNVWLQRFYLSSEPERINDIIAPDGRWLGTVTLPPGLWVLQAGPDFILAWRRDELDVEHVVLHRLHRGSE